MLELKTIEFNNISDLALTHIFECGQCFRWNKEEDYYVGITSDYVARVKIDNSKLVVETTGGSEEFWHNYFDLDTDYSDIKIKLIQADSKIKSAIEYGYGIRILNQDLFETIISFIISQNNNIPRIKKCIEALCEGYGKPLGKVFGRERYSFPTDDVLANAKLSDLNEMKLGYRSEYIKSSAAKYMKDGKPRNHEELLTYHGIGPKVANCIGLFGLRNTAAFPVDTWVRHIMNDMYGFGKKDISGMMQFAREKYGNYAGYAQQYLFYYYREK